MTSSIIAVGLVVLIGVLIGAVIVLSVLADDPTGVLISIGAAILGVLVAVAGVGWWERRRSG